MKKLLFIAALTIATTNCLAQGIDLSEVSFSHERTKPYFGKEVIDTLGTCKAVKSELETIAAQGISAFNGKESGLKRFVNEFGHVILAEQNKLVDKYQSEIDAEAENALEEEFQKLLVAASAPEEGSLSDYFESLKVSYKIKSKAEAREARKDISKTEQLNNSISELRHYVGTFIEKHSKKITNNLSGSLNWKKVATSLAKDLQKNKETIITYLHPVLQKRVQLTKQEELYSQALSSAFSQYIHDVIEKMPPVEDPKCFSYIHSVGSSEYHITMISKYYFPDREALRTDKKKVLTWKNPHYYKEEPSWAWLSEKADRKSVVTHYPVEDSYLVDSRHPEYKIRFTKINSYYGIHEEVYAAFSGDTLMGVSREFAYGAYVDEEMEQILCFYELEHNKYDINTKPEYLKDCIRYDLVTFRGGSYFYDTSWGYKKSHKTETKEQSEQYVKQLHSDHREQLGEYGFAFRRTERVDGTTFRHYIGKDEQIVIQQKFVYGNYCWKLFPYSKVTTFNPKDYVIDNNVIKKDKVLTCYYLVEKYD